jgi:GNAT superfamily N-acetyltransferase
MNFLRKSILTALILCAGYTPIFGNKSDLFDAQTTLSTHNDLQVVPFVDAEHGIEARRIFEENFYIYYNRPYVSNVRALNGLSTRSHILIHIYTKNNGFNSPHFPYSTEKAFILLHKRKVIGICVYQDYAAEIRRICESDRDYHIDRIRYIEWFAIDLAYHNKGYGKIFLQEMEKQARQNNHILELQLDANINDTVRNPSNVPLSHAHFIRSPRNFYKKLGFVPIDPDGSLYGYPYNWRMVKALAPLNQTVDFSSSPQFA